jgi:pyrroloquinoline quinone biosynthesis protein E
MMHIPGTLSRRGVLDVGLKCPHSCRHCFTREPHREAEGLDFAAMRTAEWRPTAQLIRQVELMKENGFVAFDITGGEPTLHPGIVDIVAAATRVGLASRIITLGQFLTGPKDLLGQLLDAGLTDFRFSYHAADPEIFKRMTGADVNKIQAAMRSLHKIGFQFYTNTTVTTDNSKHLPELAWDMVYLGIYGATFLMMMSHYAHADSADQGLRAEYWRVAPYMREATRILEGEGIAVTVRYAPLCSMAGLEKNIVGQVGVRHDGHEWMNAVEHQGVGDAVSESRFCLEVQGGPASGALLLAQTEKGPPIGRGTARGPTKLFAPACQACSGVAVCDGIDPGYLAAHGPSEFIPYCNDDRGNTLDRDRLKYYAGHVVKMTPGGDPKGATSRLLGLDPSPFEPFVSVVIANFNHGGEIERCIRSVVAQTYPDVEIIVVDDDSTDDSLHVLGKLKAEGLKFMVIARHENAGRPAVPRNEGIRCATGALVVSLDPDDWLAPSYVEECVATFRANLAASIVYTGIQAVGDDGVRMWVTVPYDPLREITGNYIGCMSMFTRQMWLDIGGFDEDPGLKGVEDYEFWVSATRLGHIAVPLPRQLAYYTRSETGLFETETKPNFAAKTALIRSKNQEIYPLEALK